MLLLNKAVGETQGVLYAPAFSSCSPLQVYGSSFWRGRVRSISTRTLATPPNAIFSLTHVENFKSLLEMEDYIDAVGSELLKGCGHWKHFDIMI